MALQLRCDRHIEPGLAVKPAVTAVVSGTASRGGRSLWLCLLVLGGASMTAPSGAWAHFKTGTLATDFDARVTGFRPADPDLGARVVGGDQRLELHVEGSQVVVVLGLVGEPFLRFSAAGVEANLASPTASSAGVVAAGHALSGAVRWRRLTRAHVLAWHEGRLRPLPIVRDPSAHPRAVASWSIPLRVGGKPTTLTGTEWYAAGPSVWPWLVTGVLLVLLAALAGRLPSRGLQRRLASSLLPLAVAALIAGWTGILLAGRVGAPTVAFAIGYTAATAFLLLVAVAATSGAGRLGLMALIGAFTAAFALPETAVFAHGFVFSALPPVAARLAVAVAVIGGSVTAVLCIPEVIELLGGRPAIRRGATQRHAGPRHSRI